MQICSVLLVAFLAGIASAGIINTPLLGSIVPSSPNAPQLPAGLLAYTPAQIVTAVNAISALAVSSQSAVLAAAAQGVTISTLGLTNNITVGAITLPPGYLCSNTGLLSITALASCYVCSADCTYVHNKYGGYCGIQSNPAINPNQESYVCVCGDSAPASGNVLTPYQQCGPIVAGSDLINNVIALLLQYALMSRENAQCVPEVNTSGQLVGFNSAACTVDCTTNHPYSCGVCDQEIPIQTSEGQAAATSTQNYCGCYYGQTSTDGTNQCTSTPKLYSA